MKITIAILLWFFPILSLAQNVGIGTVAPNARLEIKDTANTKVKITSKHYLDTSQLIFSNRLGDLYGTDMIMTSNREDGIRVIARSDLPNNNSDSILMITPSGRLGINKPSLPAYTLDVNGDINTAGTMRVNGNAGTNGQVLRSNGDGTMGWGDMWDYKYYEIFRTTGASTWTVPAGVTKICIELWGAGGGGAIYGGGGGGSYIKAYFTATPGSSVSYTLGVGGSGGSFAGSSANNGGTTTATVGAVTITAFGGLGASTNVVAGEWPGAGGTSSVSAGFRNYISMDGENGSHNQTTYQQKNATTYVINTKYGNGGNAGNTINTGGLGNYTIINESTSAIIKESYAIAPNTPGGGGSTFYCNICSSSAGANAQMIIHY